MPRDVARRTGEQIDRLLDDPEIKPDEIREGLALLRTKPKAGPGLLPDLVNEVRQKHAHPELGARPPGRRRPYQPYHDPPEGSDDEEPV